MDVHIGYLGNGATCYDVSRTVGGDFPTVAHISPAGNIRYYAPVDAENRTKIERTAAQHRIKFVQQFTALPEPERYARMLDALPDRVFFDYMATKRKGATLQEAIETLWPSFLAVS